VIVSYEEPGSRGWIESRLGHLTASQLSKVITPGGKLSASRETVMGQLMAEIFEGEPYVEFAGNDWTDRGHMLEPRARAYYRLRRGVTVETVGHLLTDDGALGASPDGLVGEDGGLELKCPSLPVHIAHVSMEVLPRQYIPQVQGALFVSQRQWWDFMSFSDRFDLQLLVRVEPDPAYQDALAEHLPAFNAELHERVASLIEQGATPVLEEWIPEKGDKR